MAKTNYFKRDSKKHYQTKRYKNPFFKQKTSFPWKQMMVIGGCFIGIIAVAGFTLGHPKLNLHRVSITGIEFTSQEKIESEVVTYLNQKAFLLFHRANIFLFRSKDLSEHLFNQFTFASIDVSSQATTLYIHVKERTSNLIWETNDVEYIVDLTGTIVRTKEGEDALKELPLFIDRNNLPVKIGEVVLTENEVEGTLLFHEHLQAQAIIFYDTTFDRLAGKWVSIETESGYDILFDPTGDIHSQAKRLETVLTTQVDDPSELDYIDLRFGDHVYFK
jgi:thioredoxin-related protein